MRVSINNFKFGVYFSQAHASSEVVLCEQICVRRIPEGGKGHVLVLLSARIPAGTVLEAGSNTFLQESLQMFQLNLTSCCLNFGAQTMCFLGLH